jgi:hypothetical protein
MVQRVSMEVGEDAGSQVQSLKEIKKSRRTMMLGPTLGDPANLVSLPLTPPLSERASGSINDGEEMYNPDREERYESVDLSSDDGLEWDQSDQERSSTTESEEVIIFTMDVDNRMPQSYLHAWKKPTRR